MRYAIVITNEPTGTGYVIGGSDEEKTAIRWAKVHRERLEDPGAVSIWDDRENKWISVLSQVKEG